MKGVIYCENCLADRLEGMQPAIAPPAARSGSRRPGYAGSGPNPALAGILGGIFPFGVGAVYSGQYAKGLAHLVIFVLLVWGESVIDNGGIRHDASAWASPSFTSSRSLMRCAPPRPSRWGSHPPIRSDWPGVWGRRKGSAGSACATGTSGDATQPRFPRGPWC